MAHKDKIKNYVETELNNTMHDYNTNKHHRELWDSVQNKVNDNIEKSLFLLFIIIIIIFWFFFSIVQMLWNTYTTRLG